MSETEQLYDGEELGIQRQGDIININYGLITLVMYPEAQRELVEAINKANSTVLDPEDDTLVKIYKGK